MTTKNQELSDALDAAVNMLRTAERAAGEHDQPTGFVKDAIGFALNGALAAKDRIGFIGEEIRDDNSLAAQLQDIEIMARDMGLDKAAAAIKGLRQVTHE